MSQIGERFAAVRREKRCGFIPFIVAGDPDLQTTADLLRQLSKLAPAAIEVGVPFSDPTADGPVIQRAAERARKNGTTLARVLEMTAGCRVEAPLVLFSYYNPILQFGLEKFARAVARARIAGVLTVDLPAEAAAPLQAQLRRREIDLIFLVAPTTSDERLHKIAGLASGFIYAVARTGVTGTARELADESQQLVRRIRTFSDLPIAVGFGINNRAQAKRVCSYADAAVVGSLLVGAIDAELKRRGFSRVTITQRVLELARQFV